MCVCVCVPVLWCDACGVVSEDPRISHTSTQPLPVVLLKACAATAPAAAAAAAAATTAAAARAADAARAAAATEAHWHLEAATAAKAAR